MILAAGLGTRMKSNLAKVLHPLLGRAMVGHVVEAARPVCGEIVVVVHHQADQVRAAISDVRFVDQGSPKGTGHAVQRSLEALPASGTVLVLCGDAPLVRAATIDRLLATHASSGGVCTVVTAVVDEPAAYGRIVRDGPRVRAIVEAGDADTATLAIREVNTGTYAFDLAWLRSTITQLVPHPPKGELYLTDAVALANADAHAVVIDDPDELRGVNDRWALAAAQRDLQHRVLERHALAGVTFENLESVTVEMDVVLGEDVTIGPGAVLRGKTTVAAGATIGPHVVLVDATIGPDAVILAGSVILGSEIGAGATIGPMAHVKERTVVGARAVIGNFVEVKKSRIGEDTKSKHLTYIGDADIGARSNIGAGTIFCNYDGFKKHPTHIGDDVFVGSDTVLCAPITVGNGAFVAAGSVLVEDVEPGELAIARAKQVHKPGGALMLKKKRTGG